ncbi:MAG: hypothetical protein GOVbin4162_129 [Prokaryotic dsDNA virus sp.]|nr:MAG: hypothetical protein GOVbin4162_129 [Prokaryotic dsDNA virus sp.]|tara:strand:- start:4259 stop:4660 length:402 start_codon:yes stop_codon:yes gene_type:complete
MNIDTELLKQQLTVISERGERLAKRIKDIYPKLNNYEFMYPDSDIDPECGDYEFGAYFSEPWYEGESQTIMIPIEHLVSEEAMESYYQEKKREHEEERKSKEQLMLKREEEYKQKREQYEREQYERLKQKYGE